ncbi:TolC family protein [bacterium]|nr:TolC family protein [bacterium]
MSFSIHPWCSVFTLALLLPSAIAADEPIRSGLKLSLGNAGSVVRALNPTLAAARYQIGEARGRLRQAGLLSNPEAETSFQHDPQFREHSAEFGLTQDIPVTARLRYDKEVSLAELQATEAEVADLERRLTGQVREGLIELLALRAQKANSARQAEVLQELLTFIASQVTKAEASALDLNQLKVERTQLGLAMRRLEVEHTLALSALKPLLGVPPNKHVVVIDSLPNPDIKYSPAGNEQSRPDIQAAAHLAEAAEREIQLERAKRYDDLSVGLFLERALEEDAPKGLERETAIGVRVSFPIPFWNKNKGAIEEKNAKHLRLAKEKQALESNAAHESAKARLNMQAQQDLLTEIDNTLAPQATAQINDLEQAYKKGLSNLQSVLRARRQFIKLGAARIDALRDYHLARVQLETSLALP